ncbi:hypothetical protein BconGalA64_56190 [Burkholderia contaminans]|nr:hypothetical protein BconGalA64_56190 [Burkholderia contaminans]
MGARGNRCAIKPGQNGGPVAGLSHLAAVLTESLDRNGDLFRANVETARGKVPGAVRRGGRTGGGRARQPICCMIEISFFA